MPTDHGKCAIGVTAVAGFDIGRMKTRRSRAHLLQPYNGCVCFLDKCREVCCCEERNHPLLPRPLSPFTGVTSIKLADNSKGAGQRSRRRDQHCRAAGSIRTAYQWSSLLAVHAEWFFVTPQLPDYLPFLGRELLGFRAACKCGGGSAEPLAMGNVCMY
jgi:hypothetical protein